jgi:hypothetical protein
MRFSADGGERPPLQEGVTMADADTREITNRLDGRSFKPQKF